MDEDDGTELIDPRDEIARLEARIEEFEAKIENCRKISLASRAAVIAGLLLLGLVFGAVRSDALIMGLGFIALIGGFVLMGSNRSTVDAAKTQLTDAQARRDDLINRIELRVIRGKDATSIPS